jgi:hypothetical protein
MRTILGNVAMLAATAMSMPASAASLLTNGSFEQGPALNVQGYNRGGLPTSWSSSPGWETPDILGSAYHQTGAGFAQLLGPQDGDRYLDMNGASPTGAIRQTLSGLTGGSLLKLSFWSGSWAQNSSGNLTAYLVDAANMAVLANKSIDYPYNPGATTSQWTQYFLSAVVPVSGQVSVVFSGNSGSSARGAPGLDNVALVAVPTAVPEPASWAMMIGGLAFVGGALRGRHKARAATA